jgi:hypothetical protein
MKSPFVGFMATVIAGVGLGQGLTFIFAGVYYLGSVEFVGAACLYWIVGHKYWIPIFREYRAKEEAKQT